MLPEHLKPFAETPISVLNDGHILLVDVFGGEQDIIDAARVSYGQGTKRVTEDRALLRYLLRNKHTSPFEMVEIKIRVRVPMDVWRQWIRHRTASVNETSTRYSEAINSAVKTDAFDWRLQAKDNKQGSAGFLTEGSPGIYFSQREEALHQLAREVYEERLSFGIAREQARKDLPLSTYTEAYWKCDLHNLLHFLRLRMDPHAQLEIRLYAEALATIVKAWVPSVWVAFEDYVLQAQTFSRMEMQGIKALARKVSVETLLNDAVVASGLPKGREQTEFVNKLKKLIED